MAQYINYVRTIYRQSVIEKNSIAIKWPPTPSKVYINLVCVDRTTSLSTKEADECTKAMICDGSVDVILKKKRPIMFRDVTKDLPDTALEKVVLVEGAPGVGKSTFAWEFCRRWGRGEIAKQYHLVLLLRLREERISKTQSLADLIFHSSDHIRQAVVEELACTLGVNTLIILEGFDELPSTCRTQSSVFLQLIHGQLLPFATVLVTSRPWATQDLHRECSHRIFQHIEILGFKGKQIEEYVTSVFTDEGKTVNDKAMENIKEVMSYIRRYPQIKACMYIPLNSAIVVSVYQESKAGKCILPRTLTELYYVLTETLLLRYLYGHPEYGQRKWKIQSLEGLPKEVHSNLLAINALAYSGICTDQEGGVQLIYTNEHVPSGFETLGLMQSVPQLYVIQEEDMSHNFLHLTFQEFLAALHISNMSLEQQLEHFRRQGKEERWRVVLRFLAGITKLANLSADLMKSLLLEQPNERQITERGRYCVTADVVLSSQHGNWMFETQRDDIAPVVLEKETVEYMGHKGLTLLDYYSVGYCISHSHSHWVLTIQDRRIEEEDVRMLVAGVNTRYDTSAGVVGLRGRERSEEYVGGHWPLSISTEALNVLFIEMKNVIHLQELRLELPAECSSITWPDLSGLRVLHLAISGERNWRLDTLLPHLSLESLTFDSTRDGCTVVFEDCVAIGMLLSSSNLLKCLHFQSYNFILAITPQGMEPMTKAMSENEHLPLRSVVMECVRPFSDTAAHSLAVFIRNSTTLHHLSLIGCDFSAHGLLELGQAIHHSSSLQEELKDLICTVDGDNEATDCAKLLHHYPPMVYWMDWEDSGGIRWSHITDKGAEAIAIALHYNSTLEVLDLSNNSVTDTGSAALAQALHHNSTLRQLNLSNNRINNAGSMALAQALHHNSTLRLLNLSNNRINNAGSMALAQALHHNSTLMELNLSGNDAIGEEGTHHLVQALTVNTSITIQYSFNGLVLSRRCEEYATQCPQYGAVKHRITFEEQEKEEEEEEKVEEEEEEEEEELEENHIDLGNEEGMMDEEKQRQLLDEALENGYISTGLDVLLFIGAAGSGKTCYKHLCLGLPPPEVMDSTGLSEHPVRTMSFVRGAVEQTSHNGEEMNSECAWTKVSDEQFKALIMEAVSEGEVKSRPDPVVMTYSENITAEGPPALDVNPDLNNTDHVSSTQRESVEHNEPESSKVNQGASNSNVVTQSKEPASSGYIHHKPNLYQELRAVLRRIKSSSTSQAKRVKLMDINWIYIVDSGGQPQFREMLPVLVKMATACVLTLKLNEALGDPSEVKFCRKDKQLCKPYLSILSNEQIVNHCSQILGSQMKGCKLFLVGTHQDLECECETESRKDKNEKLFNQLKPQLGQSLALYKPGDPPEVLYPVNSKTPKKEDYRVVEQFKRAVHKIAGQKKVDIPLYWFLLELLLQQFATNSGILSFEDCKKEAFHQLKISGEAFPTAVEFLAKSLGTIVYFPEVLPNVIFKPQALIDVLSEVVKLHHLLKDNHPLPDVFEECCEEWFDFQQLGIMTTNLLQTAPLKAFFSYIFTPKDFLTVMKKLLIVASIPDDAFFFPSVLEELSHVKVQQKLNKSLDCLAPLAFCHPDSAVRGRIKENWLPVGSFTSLVAKLLNDKKWTRCTDENPTCLYRNCIQFTLPDAQPGIVTLVDEFKHMEVYIFQTDPETVKTISKTIGSTIHHELEEVCKFLKCGRNVQKAFLCPQHNSSHIATLARLDDGQWRWTCREQRSISGKLTDKQLPWLQDSSGGLSTDDLAQLENTLQRVAHNCIAFGLQLGVEDHRIKVIEAQYANPCDRLREILRYRLRQLPLLTWQDIVNALRTDAVQENVLASEIESQHTYYFLASHKSVHKLKCTHDSGQPLPPIPSYHQLIYHSNH